MKQHPYYVENVVTFEEACYLALLVLIGSIALVAVGAATVWTWGCQA